MWEPVLFPLHVGQLPFFSPSECRQTLSSALLSLQFPSLLPAGFLAAAPVRVMCSF